MKSRGIFGEPCGFFPILPTLVARLELTRVVGWRDKGDAAHRALSVCLVAVQEETRRYILSLLDWEPVTGRDGSFGTSVPSGEGKATSGRLCRESL